MDAAKKKKLEAAGWRVGPASEFLGLSKEESELVDMRIALGRALRTRRAHLKLTQQQLAKRLRSSQSRVAKMEAGDPNVSFDLLFRSLVVIGASRRDLAKVIGG